MTKVSAERDQKQKIVNLVQLIITCLIQAGTYDCIAAGYDLMHDLGVGDVGVLNLEADHFAAEQRQECIVKQGRWLMC